MAPAQVKLNHNDFYLVRVFIRKKYLSVNISNQNNGKHTVCVLICRLFLCMVSVHKCCKDESVLYMPPMDWCHTAGHKFISQWWSLTLPVPLASAISSCYPSCWCWGQGDAHQGEKTVTVLHHGAPNDAPSQPLTEEKMATGASWVR